jgi:protein-S-isoprenylcysteine O-methyltransferase Ste14
MEGHAGMDMSVTEGPFLLAAAVRPLGMAVLAGASALWLLAYRELGPARTANAGQFGRAPRVRLGRGVFAWLRDPVYDAYALGLAGAGLSRGNPAYLALAAESVLLLNIAEARVERSTLSGTGTRRASNTPVGPR